MGNEAAFPPKCCLNRIPVKAINSVCTVQERVALNHKVREFSVPKPDRLYCASSTCRKFIPRECIPSNRRRDASCLFCSTKVCQICRQEGHPLGSSCPEGHELDSV